MTTRLEQRLTRLEALDELERRAPATQAELAEQRHFIAEICRAFPVETPPGESLLMRLVRSVGTYRELYEIFERKAPSCPLSAQIVSLADQWNEHDRDAATLH